MTNRPYELLVRFKNDETVSGIHVRYFISSDTHLIGSHIHNIPVISIDEVHKRGERNIVVASIGSSDLIKETLESSVSDIKIITMDR